MSTITIIATRSQSGIDAEQEIPDAANVRFGGRELHLAPAATHPLMDLLGGCYWNAHFDVIRRGVRYVGCQMISLDGARRSVLDYCRTEPV